MLRSLLTKNIIIINTLTKLSQEILRVKLGNKANKVGSRIAAEGVVIALVEGNSGVLFEANCEVNI